MDDQQNDRPELIEPKIEVQQPPITIAAPKNNHRKKLLLAGTGILLLLVVGAYAGYRYLRDANDALPSTEEIALKKTEDDTKTARVFSLENGDVYSFDKTGAVTKLFTIASQASYEQFTSPAGTYLSTSTESGLEVRRYNEEAAQVVFEKPEGSETLSYMWLDDESGLLVRTTRTEKELNATTRVQKQEFYRIKPDGSEKTMLFEHTETNGSAALVGVNVAHDEFYWHVLGEGGPREFLNVSRLSDGTLLRKHSAPNTNYDIAIGNDMYVAVVDGGRQIDARGYAKEESRTLSTALGISTEPLVGTCNKSEVIAGLYYEKSGNSVFYTLTSNVLNKTVIQHVRADGIGQPVEVYRLDGLRDHRVVFANANIVVVERTNKNALCSGDTFDSGDPTYEYVVINRSNQEVELLQVPAGQRTARFGLLAR